MKRKRMLSALLVAAMAATMFAGCGNNGGSNNSSTQGEKQQMMGILKSLQLSLLFRGQRSTMITKFSRSSLRRPA